MKGTRYGKLVLALIAVWFALALTASALHAFEGSPSQPPVALGLAATVPVLIFLVWFYASSGFRSYALGLDPRVLVFIQSLRIEGFVFLVLYSAGLLPGFFALSAGWGDITIGVTAPLAAMYLINPQRKSGFLLWQALGIADLVSAVALGAGARFISPQASATTVMAVLPMSLIPTFGVPLFFILHLICIAQARRWNAVEPSFS